MKLLYKALMDVGFYWLEFILLTFIDTLKTGGLWTGTPRVFHFLSSFYCMPGTKLDPWYSDEQVVCLVWWEMHMKEEYLTPGQWHRDGLLLWKKVFFFKKSIIASPWTTMSVFAYSFVVVCTKYCVLKWFCLIFCFKLFSSFFTILCSFCICPAP